MGPWANVRASVHSTETIACFVLCGFVACKQVPSVRTYMYENMGPILGYCKRAAGLAWNLRPRLVMIALSQSCRVFQICK